MLRKKFDICRKRFRVSLHLNRADMQVQLMGMSQESLRDLEFLSQYSLMLKDYRVQYSRKFLQIINGGGRPD
jgi:hypothetical protein